MFHGDLQGPERLPGRSLKGRGVRTGRPVFTISTSRWHSREGGRLVNGTAAGLLFRNSLHVWVENRLIGETMVSCSPGDRKTSIDTLILVRHAVLGFVYRC